MCQSIDIGRDSLYCGKFQSQAMTLTLMGHCPISNSSELFSYILQYVQVSNGLNHYFFELSCTHIDRQTDTQTDRQTDMSTL